jgi:hypothetical protein
LAFRRLSHHPNQSYVLGEISFGKRGYRGRFIPAFEAGSDCREHVVNGRNGIIWGAHKFIEKKLNYRIVGLIVACQNCVCKFASGVKWDRREFPSGERCIFRLAKVFAIAGLDDGDDFLWVIDLAPYGSFLGVGMVDGYEHGSEASRLDGGNNISDFAAN